MDRVILVFNTFEDAMDFHVKIFRIGNEKGVIYHKDLFDILNVTESDELLIHDGYGWTELRDIEIQQDNDERWVIIMPEIEKINNKRR